jgi:hypothetical protein
LLGVAGWNLYGWWLKHKLESYKAELVARGEKLTVAELMADHKTPEHNSASLFNRATARIHRDGVAGTNGPPMMKMVVPGKAMVGWQRSQWIDYYDKATNNWGDLADDLAESREGIELLHEMTIHPDLDFHLDYNMGPTLMLPHLSPLKRSAQILSAAALADLHKGDAASAAQHVRAMLAVAQGLRDEPLVISQLVRIAIAQIAVSATWELLQSPTVSEAGLKQIQADFAQQDFVGGMQRSFEMERAMGGMTIRHFRERGGIYDVYGSLMGGPGAAPASTNMADVIEERARKYFSPKEVRRNSNELLWQSALSFEDELRSMQGMQVLIGCLRAARTNQPFRDVTTNAFLGLKALGQSPEATEENGFFNFGEGDDSLASIRSMFGGTGRSLFFSLKRVGFFEASRTLTVTAIALKRHQLRHGNLPAALTELAPDFLASVPLDPVDGQPLRYQLKSDGSFLLYSIGEDGVDDGGDPTPPATNSTSNPSLQKGRDWVWPQPATAEEIRAWEEKQAKKK